VGILLTVWFAISYGAGILLVEQLNRFFLPGTGFPLGFWFAQQGSIYVFIVLILVYAVRMDRLDEQHRAERDGREEPHP
jgi:putative solute:sodium symporter small subunit